MHASNLLVHQDPKNIPSQQDMHVSCAIPTHFPHGSTNVIESALLNPCSYLQLMSHTSSYISCTNGLVGAIH